MFYSAVCRSGPSPIVRRLLPASSTGPNVNLHFKLSLGPPHNALLCKLSLVQNFELSICISNCGSTVNLNFKLSLAFKSYSANCRSELRTVVQNKLSFSSFKSYSTDFRCGLQITVPGTVPFMELVKPRLTVNFNTWYSTMVVLAPLVPGTW